MCVFTQKTNLLKIKSFARGEKNDFTQFFGDSGVVVAVNRFGGGE
jgi:hypothetical protein